MQAMETPKLSLSIRHSQRRSFARSWIARQNGKYKFIFLAPEQLHKEEALQAVKESNPSMIVIDEAHCISEWGHDFRPDYLQLGRMIELLGHPVTVALTATASRRVREEIIDRLGLKTPNIFVG